MVLCLFCFSLSFYARPRGKARPRKARSTDTRVYLQHADTLSYDIYGPHPDAQFVRGHVSFLHRGMHLTCDTAYFYENSNSFEAYGNVKLRQGDTLSLVSRRGYYDGNNEMAHAWHDVILTHRNEKLYCDTLDFDRMYGIADAYGAEGIKLTNKKDVLTADWGRHFTDTDHSEFFYNVVLTNDNGLRIDTDTMYYYNKTSRAHITGPSVIKQKNSVVHSEDCWYNTSTERSELFGRSTIYDGPKTITADSLYHDDKAGYSEGYGNVVYNDTTNRNMLTGEYVIYHDQTGEGYATNRAVAIDYSQPDTLWMHGDTIRIYTTDINTDSVQREVYCYNHVRAYRRDLQAVCDSLVFLSKDSCMTMYKDPVVWTQGSQLLGEEIKVYMNDSTIRYAEVLRQALTVEKMSDSLHFNQISSKEMRSYFVDGKVRQNWAIGNVQVVYYPIDDGDSTIIGLNYTETDTMKMYLSPERKLEKIWMSKNSGTLYPLTQTPPEKHRLPNFAWFDYMRPTHKDDIFVWKPKTAGTELKEERQRVAPRRAKRAIQSSQPQQEATATPVTPATPDNPENPATPEKPESPDNPESPENPETPASPTTPEKPSTTPPSSSSEK